MTDTTNKFLVEQNKQLLDTILDLQEKLLKAKTAVSYKDCPICSDDEKCLPHKQIQTLESLEIIDMMNDIKQKNELIEQLMSHFRELKVLQSKLPILIQEAKVSVSPDIEILQSREKQHLDFLAKIANRLKIRIDSSLERNHAMVDDTIRKLIS